MIKSIILLSFSYEKLRPYFKSSNSDLWLKKKCSDSDYCPNEHIDEVECDPDEQNTSD